MKQAHVIDKFPPYPYSHNGVGCAPAAIPHPNIGLDVCIHLQASELPPSARDNARVLSPPPRFLHPRPPEASGCYTIPPPP